MPVTATQMAQFQRDVERLNYLRSQIGEWDMESAVEVCNIAARYMTASAIEHLPTAQENER
jgi:hypothetical protein